MPFGKLFKRNKPLAAQQPSSQASTEKVVSPWEAQNQDALDQLARFVDFAEGFTIGFVEINFVNDLDEVLKALKRRPECSSTDFVVFDLSDPTLKHLKDELLGRLAQLPAPVSMLVAPKRVIVVKGLENAIGMFGDYPPVLQDLNFVRDAFIESVPYPVLFCLPSYAINRVIQFAPDFWSWKSGLFRIKSIQSSEDNASIRGLHAEKLLGSLSWLEYQERIQLLERLIQEFVPSEENSDRRSIRTGIEALVRLGELYLSRGENIKSEPPLRKAERLLSCREFQSERQEDVKVKITCLNALGRLEFNLANPRKAEKILKEALSLNDGIDLDYRGTSFFYLGQIKTQQGKTEDAEFLFQNALKIKNSVS